MATLVIITCVVFYIYQCLTRFSRTLKIGWPTDDITATCTQLTKQVVVGILLILPRQPTIADVVEVLEPLKVRYSHTSSVGKEIGDDQNPAIMEDPLGSDGSWTIGTLSNDLTFIFTTVEPLNHLLECDLKKNVPWLWHREQCQLLSVVLRLRGWGYHTRSWGGFRW